MKFRPPDIWKVTKPKPKPTLIDLLKEHLSHGSGIDSDWSFEEDNLSVRACNSFHIMDENGYYCGWLDFCLEIPKRNLEDFGFHFTSNWDREVAEERGIDEYLEEVFANDMSIVIKEMKRGGML